MRVEMVMPQMGESITEGTIVRWTKAAGDLVARDENILDISTDKVDSEIPSPAAGRLVEILAKEGETIPVGQVIAVIETEVEAGADSPSSPPAPAAAPPPAYLPPAGASPMDRPPMAPSASARPDPTEAPADLVQSAASAAAAALAALEAPPPSRPAAAPESPAAATAGPMIPRRDGDRFYSPLVRSIARAEGISAQELAAIPGTGRGGRVTREDVLAYATVRGGPAARPPAPHAAVPSAGAPPAATPGTPSPSASLPGAATPGTPPPATTPGAAPAASSAAAPLGPSAPASAAAVAPSVPAGPAAGFEALPGVAFTGLAAGTEVAFRPYPAFTVAETRSTPEGAVDVVKMDTMRQKIAEHMVRSKATSPHVASVTEVDMTRVVRYRESRKAEFEAKHGVKLTYTPFLVAAAVRALLDYPMMNASIEGTEVLVRRYVNIGVAVALDNGLIVPVVKRAEEKSFLGIARAIADLAARARSKKLLPDEVAGGTFAVTNMGSFGNLFGIPIINQPNVGILGAGAIVKRPVVVSDAIAIRDIMYLSLSYDHRIVDGALGGYFIQRVRYYLERVDLAGGL